MQLQKKKKPTAEAVVECPSCKCSLHVKIYKKRVTPVVKADFDVTAEVKKVENIR